MDPDLVERLREVAESGAPAQGEHAQDLLARLDAAPDHPGLDAEAELLIDAFQHDPYLWRQPEA